MNPEELLYSESHEWTSVAEEGGDKVATVGVSSFAAKELGDLTFVELPSVGQIVEATKPFGVIESVKAAYDIYAPVDGEVIAVNEKIAGADDDPDALDVITSDPHGEGWMVKIKITDESNLQKLLDFEAYQKQCEQ